MCQQPTQLLKSLSCFVAQAADRQRNWHIARTLCGLVWLSMRHLGISKHQGHKICGPKPKVLFICGPHHQTPACATFHLFPLFVASRNCDEAPRLLGSCVFTFSLGITEGPEARDRSVPEKKRRRHLIDLARAEVLVPARWCSSRTISVSVKAEALVQHEPFHDTVLTAHAEGGKAKTGDASN